MFSAARLRNRLTTEQKDCCLLTSFAIRFTIYQTCDRVSTLWVIVFKLVWYRKITKISPGAYIFRRPFWSCLFLEGLIFGGAYARREICVSKSIKVACSGKEIYHVCFGLLCIRGKIPSTSPPAGLYSEGRFNGGFFALRFWGAYIRRGLFSEFYGIFFIIFCLDEDTQEWLKQKINLKQ